MLVTFHSKAWSSITMFGDCAVSLLKLAGHSGTVPSALRAADVAAALQQLRNGLADNGSIAENIQPVKTKNDDPDEPAPVDLASRAFPLLQLLSAAAAQQCDVMWEAGAPVI